MLLTEIEYDDVMGCLALLGDNSSIPYPNENFDTTEDFLNLLQLEELNQIIKEWDTPLWFELDFQSHNNIRFENKLLVDFLDRLI